MGFFGMLFWFAVLWFAFRAFRGWSRCGSRGVWRDRQLDQPDNVDDQQSYIDSLESRVAELEERLDFTERLVAGRREAAV
ncbi:MAG: hypothetical protein ACJ8BF_02045 [Gemmatimonadales bacterium]